MATRTSSQTGNWSSSSTWGGSAAPGAGDVAVISNGHVVTVDTNTTVGANGSSIGHAVTINGASSGSFGTLVVATGVTLTLRGADVTSNTLMLINRYGTFAPAAGSTIVGDVASAYASIILNKGIISAVGSLGSLINFSSPSGNYAWNNAQAAEAPTIKAWDVSGAGTTGTYIAVLSRSWIANAANTALGSNGDSSLVFSSKSPAGILANEKASYALVATTGDYYVNYDIGVIWFFCPVNSAPASFQVAYKYLTNTKGWGIVSTQGTTYNQMIFDYCNFSYMGTSGTDDWAIVATSHKTTGAGGTSQTLQLTNSTVNFCKQFLGLALCSGSSTSDYININNNTFNNCQGNGTYGYCIGFDRANSTYVKLANNAINLQADFITGVCYGATVWSYIRVTGNTGIVSTLVEGTAAAGTWDDSEFDSNIVTGLTLAGTNPRMFVEMGGTSGHPLNIHDNVIMYPGRTLHFVSYVNFYNNLILRTYHHGIVATGSLDDCRLQSIHIYNNLFYGVGTALDNSGYGQSPMVECGYNHQLHIDDMQVINNTCAGSHNGYFGFGDCQDTSSVVNVMTNLQVTNNLAQSPMSGGYSARRQTAGSTVLSSVHCLLWDYNLDYNFGTRYENLSHQGMFTLSSANYNTATRNITGVALWDSSLSTFSGKSLVYTYTSQTSITLAWDSGTAIQLVFGNNTLSASATTFNQNGLATSTTLTDSGTTWTTSYGDAACPIGNWVKITSGSGSGQYAVITNCGTHTLTLAGVLSPLPASSDSYVILKSMVTLTATGGVNTVKAGIYWPSAPGSTQTDSSIGFTDHSVTGSDPLLVSPTDSGLTTASALSYKFTTSSPAKDVGLATNAPATDYFGTSRPQGGTVDMGFFEFAATAAVYPIASVSGQVRSTYTVIAY